MIPADDLEVSTYPLRPPGGQQAGTPPMGVEVRHRPTGLLARCQSERSQHRNRLVALYMIEAALTHPDFQL